jgi:2-oxoglutarate ferredoxin oxidoreductase subunit gamma
VILFDPAYVKPDRSWSAARHEALPAKDLALENFGREIFANIIFLGALARRLRLFISAGDFLRALTERTPKFSAENRRAFELGCARHNEVAA